MHSDGFYFPFIHFQNEAGAHEVGASFESVCLWESEAEAGQEVLHADDIHVMPCAEC